MRFKERCAQFSALRDQMDAQGVKTPYFRPIAKTWGSEVEVGGKRLVMIGSNDYLGLSHDPRVTEASAEAVRRWGTGPGGSRFLSGNLTLHNRLEERLAEFVGKKYALVHVTGFSTNLGALGCMITPADSVLCDRECHASIIAGVMPTKARMGTFAHNDAAHALKKVNQASENRPDGDVFLITEGVFSMSGDAAPLKEIAAIKKERPDVIIYLDEAHSLGVFGKNGQGLAYADGVTKDVDFIMGTFSKAMASIGGFIAADDYQSLRYLKIHSRTQIFSAALPAANTMAVLTCLDILEKEPERVERLHAITNKMRKGYQEIGLCTGNSASPIIPILVGSDEKAFMFSQALFEAGIFALPAIYPAVPRGEALIRTAYMSTHEDRQLDFVLEVLDKLAGEFKVRKGDFEIIQAEAAAAEAAGGARAKLSYL